MNALTAFHLERTLVDFVRRIVEPVRLDNVQVNLAKDVSFDPKERASDMTLKIPPRVTVGFLPRTVTGAIDPERLPAYPFITIRALSGRVGYAEEICTVNFTIGVYDENPDRQGGQDCLNIIEAIHFDLMRFRVIDNAFPLEPPIQWEMVDVDLFPHFLAVMTAQFKLPVPSHIEEVTTQTPWVPRDLRDLRPPGAPPKAPEVIYGNANTRNR
jgi:hypothetical protein